MTPIGLFKGEIALVTGAASNIGRAIAAGLAREGAHVICVDVDTPRNNATVAAITEQGGVATPVTADLSTSDGWQAALPSADVPVAMLIHAASPPRKEADTVVRVSESTWDAMVNTNVRSGFFLAREMGRRMSEARIKGRIVFVTSLHAGTPRNLPHYSASKAGQMMVVKELARAFGRAGIRVNAISPGAIPGGGFNAAALDFDSMVPLGRPGTADDVANMTMAVLSDRFAGYVSGANIVVDGGLDLFNWIPAAYDQTD